MGSSLRDSQQFSVNRTDIVIEEQKEKFLFEKELLNRVSDIKNKKVTPLSRDEVFDGV